MYILKPGITHVGTLFNSFPDQLAFILKEQIDPYAMGLFWQYYNKSPVPQPLTQLMIEVARVRNFLNVGVREDRTYNV